MPVFRPEKARGLPNIDEILITNIQAALLTSKQSENVHFQKTVIFSIGELGKISDGGLLLITIISLLESYMLSLPSVKVVAFSKVMFISFNIYVYFFVGVSFAQVKFIPIQKKKEVYKSYGTLYLGLFFEIGLKSFSKVCFCKDL